MPVAERSLRLFEGFGVELEYMIVSRRTLSIVPQCDRLLHAVVGEYLAEVEMGDLAWSNELVLHVVELKTNGPASRLDGLAEKFQAHVQRINALLESWDARLMPTAMHPWMDAGREMHLWPHQYSPVYEALDRIFGCRGHGWANLQCTHINLPFSGDEEFGRLHAAIRLLLPILPALAASSPIIDGRITGLLDNRLEVYRRNAERIPSITGRVIPEAVSTRAAYEAQILKPMYRDIAPFDPEGILQYEWLNARGAIARFDRSTIEIRVLDIQECPLADLAILEAVTRVLRAMVAETWCPLLQQQVWSIEPLETIFLQSLRDGEAALITNPAYLRTFGYTRAEQCTAGALWRHLCETVVWRSADQDQPWVGSLRVILSEGTLARRMVRALPAEPSRHDLVQLGEKLCDCLASGRMFHGETRSNTDQL